jgi:hypothetical protein
MPTTVAATPSLLHASVPMHHHDTNRLDDFRR